MRGWKQSQWPEMFAGLGGGMAAALAAGLAAAALAAVEPLFFCALVDTITTAGEAVAGRALELLAGLGVVWLGQRLLTSAQSLLVTRVRFGLSRSLTDRVLGQLLQRPLGFHEESGPGYMLTRLERGVTALTQMAADGLQIVGPNLLNLGLMGWLLWGLSPRLALLAMAPMPALLWISLSGAGRMRAHEEAVQEGWGRLYERVHEVLHSIKTVQSLAAEERESAAYSTGAGRIFRRLWRMAWLDEGYGQVKSGLATAGRLATAGAGLHLVAEHRLTPGAWVAATSYAALLYGPLNGSAATLSGAARQAASTRVLFTFLRDAPEAYACSAGLRSFAPPAGRGAREAAGIIGGYRPTGSAYRWAARRSDFRWPRFGFAPEPTQRPPRAEVADPATGGRRAIRGEIVFDDVSFAYGAGQPALMEVSFRIAAGETVAILGPSGGGKTTLTDLLLGFYPPTKGTIRIDGEDLRQWTGAEWRRQVGVVLQDPVLLRGTIAENIAYGAPGSVTEAAVREAARAAQADGFIAALADGYATRLGEHGARLSGGEKQRIAIARALLRDPRVVVLDEATAHLDAAAEAAVARALEALLEGRTALVISHRLAATLRPDRVLMLDRGRLVEAGAAEELGQRAGAYREWRRVQAGFAPAG